MKNKMGNKTNYYGGIGIIEFLTLFLSTAKFTGYWSISWWLVFAPMWVPAAIVLLFILLTMLVAVIGGLLEWVN